MTAINSCYVTLLGWRDQGTDIRLASGQGVIPSSEATFFARAPKISNSIFNARRFSVLNSEGFHDKHTTDLTPTGISIFCKVRVLPLFIRRSVHNFLHRERWVCYRAWFSRTRKRIRGCLLIQNHHIEAGKSHQVGGSLGFICIRLSVPWQGCRWDSASTVGFIPTSSRVLATLAAVQLDSQLSPV